jgi:hypothetical protein
MLLPPTSSLAHLREAAPCRMRRAELLLQLHVHQVSQQAALGGDVGSHRLYAGALEDVPVAQVGRGGGMV